MARRTDFRRFDRECHDKPSFLSPKDRNWLYLPITMSNRTHHIQLPEALDEKLRERAAQAGTDADTFIVHTLEEKLKSPKSFKELFAPLQEAMAESGQSREALDQTFKELLQAVRRSRRAQAS